MLRVFLLPLALFVFSVLWIVYVYFGYPVALRLLGLFRRKRFSPDASYTPSVSVLIAARNEEKDIAWKIRETLSWNYPADRLEVLVASDASDDRTETILRSIEDSRFKFIVMPERGGKNRALNALVQIAQGEILFFTDANSRIETDCLRRMARWFADPGVGSVTGWEKTIKQGEAQTMEEGGQTYLGHESWVNTLESSLGSVLVCDGSIFCIRRELFSSVDPDLANDLELPIHIGAAGFSLVYESTAASFEKATSSFKEEFNRRRRICGQGVLGLWRLRNQISGLRAWQFLSRKVMRWFAFVPLVLVLLSSVALSRNLLFAAFALVQIAFYSLAFVGWLFARNDRHLGRITSLPFYFTLLNAAAVGGVVDAIRGRRYAIWQSPALSRGDNSCISVESVDTASRRQQSITVSSQMESRKCIFSVDVEDWFHILDVPSAPALKDWDGLPSRVEGNLIKLLDIFAQHEARVTCFFLGWVAERFPHLVKRAAEGGHEIASHGYSHTLVYQMSRAGFLDDIVRSKELLEDIAGREVLGYRAPGFSVVDETPWFFDSLIAAGYRYDSSLFPAGRGHGGCPRGEKAPHTINRDGGAILEFPVTVTPVLGKELCFFGGGYLRLTPLATIRNMARKVLSEGRPVVFYVHPREIDPSHPRLAMSSSRRFKSYVNLKSTEPKIRELLTTFEMTSFEGIIQDCCPEFTEVKKSGLPLVETTVATVSAGGLA